MTHNCKKTFLWETEKTGFCLLFSSMALEITFRHKFAVQKLFLNIPFQIFLYHGKFKLNLNFHCVFFFKPAFNTFYLDLSLNITGGKLEPVRRRRG